MGTSRKVGLKGMAAIVVILMAGWLIKKFCESEPDGELNPSEVGNSKILPGEKSLLDIEALQSKLPDRLDGAIEPRFASEYGQIGTPADDLQLVQNLLLNFRLLVKDHARIPFGGNSDFVRVLAGANMQRIALIDYTHPFINEKGELLDRWGGVLFFHQESSDVTALRSAGPDGKMWTEDDVFNDPLGGD